MDKKFHGENRRKVAAHMAGNEAMLFFSGEPVRKTADEEFPFFANRNFLYLTGIKQERSALVLQKRGQLLSECLFVTKPNFEREIWTGRRLKEDEIHEISGVEGVEDIEPFAVACLCENRLFKGAIPVPINVPVVGVQCRGIGEARPAVVVVQHVSDAEALVEPQRCRGEAQPFRVAATRLLL